VDTWPGRPFPLGATADDTGTNFALFSAHATAVDLCLFDDNGAESRVRLGESTFHVWHGYLPSIGAGAHSKLSFADRIVRQLRWKQPKQYLDNIALGRPNNWRCRAGSRYLYICENGLVHYCSQQRGYPGTPLAEYTVADVRREFLTQKSCAPNCTISCVHQTSLVDFWRAPQTLASHTDARHAAHQDLVQIKASREEESVMAD